LRANVATGSWLNGSAGIWLQWTLGSIVGCTLGCLAGIWLGSGLLALLLIGLGAAGIQAIILLLDVPSRPWRWMLIAVSEYIHATRRALTWNRAGIFTRYEHGRSRSAA
jgi:hypothetical protein